MKPTPQNRRPDDAGARRAIKPVICYPTDTLPPPDMTVYTTARNTMKLIDQIFVPPREANTFRVAPGDYLEFFAEINLLGALSACPGGDCSTGHSSDKATCYPLKIEIFHPQPQSLKGWTAPQPSAYSRSHGASMT